MAKVQNRRPSNKTRGNICRLHVIRYYHEISLNSRQFLSLWFALPSYQFAKFARSNLLHRYMIFISTLHGSLMLSLRRGRSVPNWVIARNFTHANADLAVKMSKYCIGFLQKLFHWQLMDWYSVLTCDNQKGIRNYSKMPNNAEFKLIKWIFLKIKGTF